MAQRLDLQDLLAELLGSTNVYFQPPPDSQMEYPCIVYHIDDFSTEFADNNLYSYKTRYQVTVIAVDPDSVIPAEVLELPMCSFDRFFVADQLNHFVFKLFF